MELHSLSRPEIKVLKIALRESLSSAKQIQTCKRRLKLPNAEKTFGKEQIGFMKALIKHQEAANALLKKFSKFEASQREPKQS